MRLVSTRGGAPGSDVRSALFRGLAPDGGLYQPASLPRLDPGETRAFREAGWPGTAVRLARRLLADEWEAAELDALVRDALDFPVPLRRVTDRVAVLELFHGPTLAFKDAGARFLAGAMASVHRERGGPPPTVLVATSGDTGSAVGDAFRRLTDFSVVILYPEGRIAERQERHLARIGGNVTAVAVERAAFDDCQRLVKGAFADPELRQRARLTSANSINIGRLLPQIFYYFHAVARLGSEPGVSAATSAGGRPAAPGTAGAGRSDGDLLISVPSGNLGNLTAGLMALRMGLVADGFVAATNRNDVLPRYLETGRAEAREAVATPSSAMDVGDPSNLERIRHLYGDDVSRLREDLSASSHGDDATRRTIARVHREHGYTLDPHTAVGWRALETALEERPAGTGIVVSTAHPAKFRDVVEPLVEGEVFAPERWTAALEGEGRTVRMEPDQDALRELLLER